MVFISLNVTIICATMTESFSEGNRIMMQVKKADSDGIPFQLKAAHFYKNQMWCAYILKGNCTCMMVSVIILLKVECLISGKQYLIHICYWCIFAAFENNLYCHFMLTCFDWWIFIKMCLIRQNVIVCKTFSKSLRRLLSIKHIQEVNQNRLANFA